MPSETLLRHRKQAEDMAVFAESDTDIDWGPGLRDAFVAGAQRAIADTEARITWWMTGNPDGMFELSPGDLRDIADAILSGAYTGDE